MKENYLFCIMCLTLAVILKGIVPTELIAFFIADGFLMLLFNIKDGQKKAPSRIHKTVQK